MKAVSLNALAFLLLCPLGAKALPTGYLKLKSDDNAFTAESDRVPEAWQGWMAVEAFGHQLDLESSVPSEGRRVPTIGKTFSVVRPLDKATPKLVEALAEGRVFPKLTLVYLGPENKRSEETVQFLLEDVQVVDHRVHMVHAQSPSENVSFSFAAATLIYEPLEGDPDRPQRALFDRSGPDRNANGLPDAFEEAFAMRNADEDADGDGQTLRQEFAAGTAPNDRRSRFGIDRITMRQDEPGVGCVEFQTLPGRTYRLLGSPTGQHWVELDRFTLADDAEGGATEWDLPISAFTQLLRVEVSLAE